MLTFNLYADRDGARKFITSSLVADRLAMVVETLEETGEWPEGWDALMVDVDGNEYVLADGWEKIGD